MAGVDLRGLTIKSLEEIRSDITDELKTRFGNDIRTDENSVFGLEIDTHSNIQSDIWLKMQDVYLSRTLRGATGVQLDSIGEIIGRQRIKATRSTVALTFSGTDGTTIPINTKCKDVKEQIWITDEDGVIAGGVFDVSATAEKYGYVSIGANEINTIIDNIGNVTVTNANPSIPGNNRETDAEYRTRLYNSSRGSSKGVYDALRDSIYGLNGVTYSRVIENTSDSTDGDNVPPHGFTVVVEGGDDKEIANTIWQNKPAGINMGGSNTYTIIDSSGYTHDMKFQRPDLIEIYVAIELTPLGDWGSTHEEAMKQNIVTKGSEYFQVGDDINASWFYTPVNEIGEHNVSSLVVDKVDPPVATNPVAISNIQRGVLDVSRITITVV